MNPTTHNPCLKVWVGVTVTITITVAPGIASRVSAGARDRWLRLRLGLRRFEAREWLEASPHALVVVNIFWKYRLGDVVE